ncbi:Receptor-type tyrosine-protein phosphatase C [Toxocara canis]|uniref:Receptor-type tyrosine-protein phosphatase C n=1 Tax=Toxocara canis TaxID=6265 RepID=A0A0B2VG36_TOXCA|nr:Receptor-type tyrosine-protein phosphatase C [Toxocara canis]
MLLFQRRQTIRHEQYKMGNAHPAQRKEPINKPPRDNNIRERLRTAIRIPHRMASKRASTRRATRNIAPCTQLKTPTQNAENHSTEPSAETASQTSGESKTALQKPQSTQQVVLRKATNNASDLETAQEKREKPASNTLHLGTFSPAKNDKTDDDLKTAEEATKRSKWRRLMKLYKKKSEPDTAQTAQESASRSRFRAALKFRKVRHTQDSMRTAKERHRTASAQMNIVFPASSKTSEGTISGCNETEEKTQEQENAPSAENADRKAQNEVQAWVERMLQKGVRGLRQEFFRLRLATNPTADQYQQFTINAPFGRNRYRDVFCLDESRIVLRNHPSGNDYIHANYVSTPLTQNRFICAQAPKDETVYDFWLMILQEQIEVIIMLGDFIEKQRPKCAHYFPQEENGVFVVNDINVECTLKTTLPDFPFKMLRRSLMAKRNGTSFVVTHYHWCAWPDHGVPNADKSPFRLLQLVRSTKRPICVHCSAGIGRTGSIVAIEYILELLKAHDSCDDLVDIVKKLRTQRAGIVQTDLQYLYVHRVMLIYFTDLKLITESDRLHNFIHDYEQLIPPFQ